MHNLSCHDTKILVVFDPVEPSLAYSEHLNSKFIIVTQPKETRGLLRMGMVISHRDLVVGYEKVHGGGWWKIDEKKKEIILYGASGDFGEADYRFLDMMPREFRDYALYHIYTFPNFPCINDRLQSAQRVAEAYHLLQYPRF